MFTKLCEIKMKILIIRFSSFGDIAQCMGALTVLRSMHPHAQIDWVTKESFRSLVTSSDEVHQVHTLSSKAKLKELFQLGIFLRKQKYDLIYDAHANLRSMILRKILFGHRIIARSKNRWKRFLLFKLRINKFPQPFKGMLSYTAPLSDQSPKKLNLNFKDIEQEKISSLVPSNFQKAIVLAPSAAWDMKRWPIQRWKELIASLADQKFILLGGPEDTFFKEFESENVLNLAGKLSFLESAYIIHKSVGLISADTGSLHLADLMGKEAIGLIGPTAFGYPTMDSSLIIEKDFNCRPCTKDGRGKCSQKIYQECMIQISAKEVSDVAKAHFFDLSKS